MTELTPHTHPIDTSTPNQSTSKYNNKQKYPMKQYGSINTVDSQSPQVLEEAFRQREVEEGSDGKAEIFNIDSLQDEILNNQSVGMRSNSRRSSSSLRLLMGVLVLLAGVGSFIAYAPNQESLPVVGHALGGIVGKIGMEMDMDLPEHDIDMDIESDADFEARLREAYPRLGSRSDACIRTGMICGTSRFNSCSLCCEDPHKWYGYAYWDVRCGEQPCFKSGSSCGGHIPCDKVCCNANANGEDGTSASAAVSGKNETELQDTCG